MKRRLVFVNVFIDVLNIYPNPYFIHSFPIFANSYSFENDTPLPFKEEMPSKPLLVSFLLQQIH